jgi:hypothetical protein
MIYDMNTSIRGGRRCLFYKAADQYPVLNPMIPGERADLSRGARGSHGRPGICYVSISMLMYSMKDAFNVR